MKNILLVVTASVPLSFLGLNRCLGMDYLIIMLWNNWPLRRLSSVSASGSHFSAWGAEHHEWCRSSSMLKMLLKLYCIAVLGCGLTGDGELRILLRSHWHIITSLLPIDNGVLIMTSYHICWFYAFVEHWSASLFFQHSVSRIMRNYLVSV